MTNINVAMCLLVISLLPIGKWKDDDGDHQLFE